MFRWAGTRAICPVLEATGYESLDKVYIGILAAPYLGSLHWEEIELPNVLVPLYPEYYRSPVPMCPGSPSSLLSPESLSYYVSWYPISPMGPGYPSSHLCPGYPSIPVCPGSPSFYVSLIS